MRKYYVIWTKLFVNEKFILEKNSYVSVLQVCICKHKI